MEEEKIECTGKGVFSLIMGVICLAMAILFIDYNYKDGAGNNSGIFSSNFSIGLAMYYLLY